MYQCVDDIDISLLIIKVRKPCQHARWNQTVSNTTNLDDLSSLAAAQGNAYLHCYTVLDCSHGKQSDGVATSFFCINSDSVSADLLINQL